MANGLSNLVADGQIRPVSADAPKLATVFPAGDDLFRGLIESLAEGVILTDGEGRIVYANRRIADLSGYPREQLLGRIAHEIFLPPERWPAMQARLKDRLDGKTEYFETQMTGKDGAPHWVAVRSSPFRNCRGDIVGAVDAFSCIERQKSLELENQYLQDEVRSSFGDIVGRSEALRKVLAQVGTVAPTEANVLIMGESGTGKELIARAVHDLSPRKDRALVRVNCAAIPKELFESEFFGHARGSFTGAIKDRIGRFELADGGTLFLDEIGEIPVELQGKLLRVLQEGQFERLGEDRTRAVKVRLIAATNRDLLAEARSGRFRIDLYYRLSVFPIELPPLRERVEDVIPLAEHFIGQAARRLGVAPPRFTRFQLEELQAYEWPGNVRELQNVVERAVILARGGALQFDLPKRGAGLPPGEFPARAPAPEITRDGPGGLSLDELVSREREIVTAALRRTRGRIYGSGGAAVLLRIRPTTLASKIKRLKIDKNAV